MVCPNCSSEYTTIEVLDKYREVIKIDRCDSCGSFSLDRHELNRLDQETTEKIDVASRIEDEEDHPFDCPHCHIPMKIIADHKHNDAKLQVCEECFSIFLKRGYLSRYYGIKQTSQVELPDTTGIFSSRDRILASLISIIIILFGATIAYLKQADYFTLSADEIVGSSNPNSSALFYVTIGGIFILFIFGLILSISKQNRSIRLLGWSTVLLSIALIFILSV